MIKKIFVVVMLLAFAAWYFLRPGTLAPKPPGAAQHTQEPAAEEHSLFETAQARTPKKLNIGEEDEISALKSGASIREQMPSLADIRKESQKNPEATPTPLLKFSLVLNSKTKLAMKSEAAGRVVMSQLQDCALASESQTTRSVSAMCLLSAHRISNKYASLDSDVETLDSHVDPKTLSIYRSMLQLNAK